MLARDGLPSTLRSSTRFTRLCKLFGGKGFPMLFICPDMLTRHVDSFLDTASSISCYDLQT